MGIFTFFKILFFVFQLIISTSANDCTKLKCNNNHSLEIRSPLSKFNLFCKQNNTLINFPNYGDLTVKSISYDSRTLQLIDPKACVHEVFLNLNLTSTPFKYYYVLKQYKYINCSAKLDSYVQVPCLSGSNYRVYIVAPSFKEPAYCNHVKTVGLPFSYSPYLSDNSFGLRLTWDSVGATSHWKGSFLSGKWELKNYIKALFAISVIVAFIVAVGVLFRSAFARYHSKEHTKDDRVKSVSYQVEIDGKFLGEYEALTPANNKSSNC